MKKLKLLTLSFIFLLIPALSLGATGHINGCTNTRFDTNCCTKTFKITAQSGYTVTDVIVNGVSQGAITSYTFSNISGPQTLKVITTSNGSGGSTGGSTGGTSGGTTSTDCAVMVNSGVTVKYNGSTLSTGSHTIPKGSTITISDSITRGVISIRYNGFGINTASDTSSRSYGDTDKVSVSTSFIVNNDIVIGADQGEKGGTYNYYDENDDEEKNDWYYWYVNIVSF